MSPELRDTLTIGNRLSVPTGFGGYTMVEIVDIGDNVIWLSSCWDDRRRRFAMTFDDLEKAINEST